MQWFVQIVWKGQCADLIVKILSLWETAVNFKKAVIKDPTTHFLKSCHTLNSSDL